MRRGLLLWAGFLFIFSEDLRAEDFFNGPETNRCLVHLLHHISPPDTLPGTVVAGRSKEDPNYWYHWTRDAALVMRMMAEMFAATQEPHAAALFSEHFRDYLQLTKTHQLESVDLGEPKFEVNGAPYSGEWGRPQNDGPALRAITILRWRELLSERQLLDSFPDLIDLHGPESILIRDLDFVAARWQDPNFDIWEEINGDHFYNRVVQAAALYEGARVLETEDPIRAGLYRAEAEKIRASLFEFIDASGGRYRATINRVGGVDYKQSQLDAAIILAALHAHPFAENILSFSDPLLINSFHQLEASFAEIYGINQRSEWLHLGNAIGRYPEDRYDGHRTGSLGNPWFLTTLAYAEFLYRLRDELRDQKRDFRITANTLTFIQSLWPERAWNLGHVIEFESNDFDEFIQRLERKALRYFDRVHLHWSQSTETRSGEQMMEQFHREHGFMQGAVDLTWSYTAYLRASLARGI